MRTIAFKGNFLIAILLLITASVLAGSSPAQMLPVTVECSIYCDGPDSDLFMNHHNVLELFSEQNEESGFDPEMITPCRISFAFAVHDCFSYLHLPEFSGFIASGNGGNIRILRI